MDDKQIFEQVKQVYNNLNYEIQTKYNTLNHNFQNFKLMPLLSIII